MKTWKTAPLFRLKLHFDPELICLPTTQRSMPFVSRPGSTSRRRKLMNWHGTSRLVCADMPVIFRRSAIRSMRRRPDQPNFLQIPTQLSWRVPKNDGRSENESQPIKKRVISQLGLGAVSFSATSLVAPVHINVLTIAFDIVIGK